MTNLLEHLDSSAEFNQLVKMKLEALQEEMVQCKFESFADSYSDDDEEDEYYDDDDEEDEYYDDDDDDDDEEDEYYEYENPYTSDSDEGADEFEQAHPVEVINRRHPINTKNNTEKDRTLRASYYDGEDELVNF